MLLGAHISIADGIAESLIKGKKIGCDTIQIFVKSNLQWKARDINKFEIHEFLRNKIETKINPVIAHSSYLINLASYNKRIRNLSIKSFRRELEIARVLKIPYFIFHPGYHKEASLKTGIHLITKALNQIISKDDSKTKILLETTSGQGSSIGYGFEQLAEIISLVNKKKRIGVCLDTCHVFTAGYEIRNRADYEKTLEKFEKIIGIKKIKVFHLNDSRGDLGSKIDRHQHIGKGYLGLEPFRFILNDKRFQNIPMIIETPKNHGYEKDIENLTVLRSLIKNI
jgi:deoxyribonuclease-4